MKSWHERSCTALGERVLQPMQLALAADASASRSGARARRVTASSGYAATGSLLPFSSSGRSSPASTAAADERERVRADQHLSRLRRLLEARRHVDRVAGRQPLLGARSRPRRC